MLVVAVINVDAYPFQVFSDRISHLKNTGVGEFGCNEHLTIQLSQLPDCQSNASALSAQRIDTATVLDCGSGNQSIVKFEMQLKMVA